MMKEYDVVELLADLPKIKQGSKGAILIVYKEPNLAYEVEFLEDNAQTYTLKPEQLKFISNG